LFSFPYVLLLIRILALTVLSGGVYLLYGLYYVGLFTNLHCFMVFRAIFAPVPQVNVAL